MINNYGNGIMIEGDMPSINGTWYNPSTGDAINVRDSYFEDGQMKIITTDGRVLSYAQMEKYIKSDSGKVPKMPKNQGYTQKVDELPPEVSSILEGFSSPPYNTAVSSMSVPKKQYEHSENWKIIDKVFNKIKNEPKFNILISWDPYPTKEIETLIDIMDIPIEEIVNYCCDKYIDDSLFEEVKENLKNYITQ